MSLFPNTGGTTEVSFKIGLATLTAVALSAARFLFFPDKAGTLAVTADIAPDAISGMQIRTTSTTIIVSEGYAKTDTGEFVTFSGSTISSARASNTTYHLYLLDNGTVARSTTAPDVPFFGSARGMTGQTGRRYIGSVRTGDGTTASNYILQQSDWGQNNVRVSFLQNTGAAPLSIHAAGAAVAPADASASPMVYGLTATSLRVRVYNNGAASSVRIYAYTGAAFSVWTNLPVVNQINTVDVPCDTTPKIQYDNTVAGGTASITLMGYEFAR